ncbi:unnamed protein product [Choristocarpus tenellus]
MRESQDKEDDWVCLVGNRKILPPPFSGHDLGGRNWSHLWRASLSALRAKGRKPFVDTNPKPPIPRLLSRPKGQDTKLSGGTWEPVTLALKTLPFIKQDKLLQIIELAKKNSLCPPTSGDCSSMSNKFRVKEPSTEHEIRDAGDSVSGIVREYRCLEERRQQSGGTQQGTGRRDQRAIDCVQDQGNSCTREMLCGPYHILNKKGCVQGSRVEKKLPSEAKKRTRRGDHGSSWHVAGSTAKGPEQKQQFTLHPQAAGLVFKVARVCRKYAAAGRLKRVVDGEGQKKRVMTKPEFGRFLDLDLSVTVTAQEVDILLTAFPRPGNSRLVDVARFLLLVENPSLISVEQGNANNIEGSTARVTEEDPTDTPSNLPAAKFLQEQQTLMTGRLPPLA